MYHFLRYYCCMWNTTICIVWFWKT